MPGDAYISACLAAAEGLEGWRQVVGEVKRTLDDPLRGLPLVAAVGAFLLIIWLNLRFARMVLARLKEPD